MQLLGRYRQASMSNGKGDMHGRSTLLGSDEEGSATEHRHERDHSRHPTGPYGPVHVAAHDQAAVGQVLRSGSRAPLSDPSIDQAVVIRRRSAPRSFVATSSGRLTDMA